MSEHTEMATDAPEADVVDDKSQKSAGAQARYAAIKRLIESNQDEFNAMYVEEAEKRGVRTRESAKQAKIEKLKAELATLEA